MKPNLSSLGILTASTLLLASGYFELRIGAQSASPQGVGPKEAKNPLLSAVPPQPHLPPAPLPGDPPPLRSTNTPRSSEWWIRNGPKETKDRQDDGAQERINKPSNPPPEWRTNVPPAFRTNVPPEWWTNPPPTWWSNLPPSTWSNVPPHWWSNVPPHWREALPYSKDTNKYPNPTPR